MNHLSELQDLYGELETLKDLERRLRALTEFDQLQVHVHRSGEVIDLDPMGFMQPLVNKVREDIRVTGGKITRLMTIESMSVQNVVITNGPVSIDIPERKTPPQDRPSVSTGEDAREEEAEEPDIADKSGGVLSEPEPLVRAKLEPEPLVRDDELDITNPHPRRTRKSG